MSRPIDLSGKRYGRLTVIRRADKKDTNNSRAYWECVCDCGNKTVVYRSNLTSGKTTSCGCFQQEKATEQATKHNGAGTRLYRIWIGLRGRCSNPNVPHYTNYGGRGIKVCDEWQTFEPFYEWAMANGYRDDLTIDRKDNDGDYCPENCRWATNKEQSNNTRKTIKIEFNGQTKTLSDWAQHIGVRRECLWKRIYLRHWSIEKALNTPPKNNFNK